MKLQLDLTDISTTVSHLDEQVTTLLTLRVPGSTCVVQALITEDSLAAILAALRGQAGQPPETYGRGESDPDPAMISPTDDLGVTGQGAVVPLGHDPSGMSVQHGLGDGRVQVRLRRPTPPPREAQDEFGVSQA